LNKPETANEFIIIAYLGDDISQDLCMKNFLLLRWLVMLFLFGSFSSCHQKAPFSHEEIMAKDTRTEKSGWILIHVEGAPAVIGYQHGYLLAAEIVDLKGALAVLNEKQTGKNWEFYRNESFRLFWSKIPEGIPARDIRLD
jgi:hypothetical protein